MIEVARKYDTKYDLAMERITISLDKDLLKAIKRVAGARGVSKFMAAAAEKELGLTELYEWFEEMEKKYGRSSQAELDAIDRDMRKIFGMPPRRGHWIPKRRP